MVKTLKEKKKEDIYASKMKSIYLLIATSLYIISFLSFLWYMKKRLKYTNPYSQPFSLIYDEEVKIYKSLLPAIFFDLWWRG